MQKKIVVAVLILLSFLSVILIFLMLFPQLSGHVVSTGHGGQAYTLSLHLTPSIWHGYYGLVGANGLYDNLTFNGAEATVEGKDLKLDQCYQSPLYASTLSVINWNLVTAGNYTTVNTFIGISDGSPVSAKYVFYDNATFLVNGNTLLLSAAKMHALSGTYFVGLLQQGATPIYVTPIIRGISFTNTTVDYQMVLPSPPTHNLTYFFYLDPKNPCTQPPTNPTYPTGPSPGGSSNETFPVNQTIPLDCQQNGICENVRITYPVSDQQLIDGYTHAMREMDRFMFEFKNGTYYARVEGMGNETILLSILPIGMPLTLRIGERKGIDLNGDGLEDIIFWFDRIHGDKVDLGIRASPYYISEIQTPAPTTVNREVLNVSSLICILLPILLMILLLILCCCCCDKEKKDTRDEIIIVEKPIYGLPAKKKRTLNATASQRHHHNNHNQWDRKLRH